MRTNSDRRRRVTRQSIQWCSPTNLWFRGRTPDRSGYIHFLRRIPMQGIPACDCTVLTDATQQSHRRLNVTERNETETISRRRAFSLLGLAALSLAMAPMVLTVSDAEAQQPSTTSGQNPQTGTGTTPQTGTATAPKTGAERRHERRKARRERRHERREARRERRHERREVRHERREERTTGRANRRQQRNRTKPTAPSNPQ
jgi:hypothetical protein